MHKNVYKQLKRILGDREKGIADFISSKKIPVEMMSGIVCDLVEKANKLEEQRYCASCERDTNPKAVCSNCSKLYFLKH